MSSSYQATKAGMIGLNISISGEPLADKRIRVNAIAPGTGMDAPVEASQP